MTGSTHSEGCSWLECRALIEDFARRFPSVRVAIVQSTADVIDRAYASLEPFKENAQAAMVHCLEEADDEFGSILTALAAELHAHAVTPQELSQAPSSS